MPRKRKPASEKIEEHFAMKARALRIVERMDTKQLKKFLGYHPGKDISSGTQPQGAVNGTN